MIEKAAASVAEPHQVRVCIDIDASYMALNGLLRAGARRSPIRTPGEAAALAAAVVARPGLRLVGLMAYEGQIAGVGDRPAGRPSTAWPSATCSGSPAPSLPGAGPRSSLPSGTSLRSSS